MPARKGAWLSVVAIRSRTVSRPGRQIVTNGCRAASRRCIGLGLERGRAEVGIRHRVSGRGRRENIDAELLIRPGVDRQRAGAPNGTLATQPVSVC
jgi:hypothetical protein